MARLDIRVTKDSHNDIQFELMHGGEKIKDISFYEILEMVDQFLILLRNGLVRETGEVIITIGGHQTSAGFIDVVEMLTTFSSSLRWQGVK